MERSSARKIPQLDSFKYKKTSPPQFSNGVATNGHKSDDNESPVKPAKFSRKAKRLRINSSSASDSDDQKIDHKAVSARDRLTELRKTRRGTEPDDSDESGGEDEDIQRKSGGPQKRKANGDVAANLFSTEKLEVEKVKKSRPKPSSDEDDDDSSGDEVNGGSKREDIRVSNNKRLSGHHVHL